MINENQKFSELQKAILETLAFFDIFNYPLTSVEIYKWLHLKPNQTQTVFSLADVIFALNGDWPNQVIASQSGFYFLANRQQIVKTRLDRYQIAEKKMKIALSTIKHLRHLAFIKTIAICNTVGYNNASPSSDIDFFIIIKTGRLWWSRLIITLLVGFLGIRRHDKKIADRVCLSFYITDSHLDLADIALPSSDIYLNYWLATLAPVYDDGTYQKFLAANQKFFNFLPNFYSAIMSSRRFVSNNWLTDFSKKTDELFFSGFFGDFLEKFAKTIELKKMKKRSFSSGGPTDTEVVINDTMLKFHENDRRQEYQSLWQKRLNDLNISN
ncbi:MAG: hypothetical protein WCW26_05090 [Candidatus Buchananbacteria bacterium]